MARLILPNQSVFDLNGHPLPGAKMYFFESGTTDPKDTFSDEALTTPNANPVIADSQGQFSNIFITGSYSVRLDDADDVTQPDYPAEIEAAADSSSTVLLTGAQTIAGVKTFTDRLAVKADTPTVEIEENDAPSDNRKWQFVAIAEQFIFRVANDVRDTFSSIFEVDRTGTTVDTVNILSTNLQHNGDEVLTNISAVEFEDNVFRIKDNVDDTKKIAFEASDITTGTTRTTTMPDKDLTFDYGTYSPSATIVSNMDSVNINPSGGTYLRVGNIVNVTIPTILLNATAASFAAFRVTLPIASNLAGDDCGGSGAADDATNVNAMRVAPDTTNDEALVEYVASGTGSFSSAIIFTYQIK